MTFFEPPPRPAPREEPFEPQPDPPWERPPDNVLGGVVPLQLLLARSDSAAITVREVVAYGSGFSFELAAIRKPPADSPRARRRRLGFAPFDIDYDGEGNLSPEFIRFGIEFADGAKVTNLEGPLAGYDPAERERPPTGPVLIEGGGGGSDGHYDVGYWVWPLPPPGALAFVCEWPAEGISLTRTEIDANLILAAASRAELLWGDDEERVAEHYRSSSGHSVAFAFGEDDDDEDEDAR